jgi:hypothetical protein
MPKPHWDFAPGPAPAGSTGAPAPSTASGSPIVPAAGVIEARAYLWHSGHLGRACECWDRGTYPCPDCRQEILDLTELLDGVVRDTIRVVTVALERLR